MSATQIRTLHYLLHHRNGRGIAQRLQTRAMIHRLISIIRRSI